MLYISFVFLLFRCSIFVNFYKKISALSLLFFIAHHSINYVSMSAINRNQVKTTTTRHFKMTSIHKMIVSWNIFMMVFMIPVIAQRSNSANREIAAVEPLKPDTQTSAASSPRPPSPLSVLSTSAPPPAAAFPTPGADGSVGKFYCIPFLLMTT